MAYLKDHGYEARAFYLNVLYVLFILLGSLYAATLNVGVEQGTGATAFSLPRYQVCKMGPISTDEIGELAEAEKVRAAASSDTDEPAATPVAIVRAASMLRQDEVRRGHRMLWIRNVPGDA